MITFDIGLYNPFSSSYFGTAVYGYTRALSKFKVLEVSARKNTRVIAAASFNCSIRESHAGLLLELGLLSFSLTVHVYDSRHWDHERGEWERNTNTAEEFITNNQED